MTAAFRTYDPEPRFGTDYMLVRDFLLSLDSSTYSFGRWDWMITHGCLDASGLPRIGLWEDGGRIVAVATYDCRLGEGFLLTDAGHRRLFEEMLAYAREAFVKDGAFRVPIRDGDMEWQGIAARLGFCATQDRECDAIYPIDDIDDIRYTLPDGFTITSFADTPDLYEYGRVLWKGFNHEADGQGAFDPTPERLRELEAEMYRPNLNPSLKIAVVAPDGHFASYCGMWQDDGCLSALVEPVATDPAYRRMGLGRAAVLEAVQRCGALGAKRAYVGSSQRFYYRIGFRPYASSTWWAAR